MRVLIAGGGIAGLTLAYWLHKSDIPTVVIEQANEIRRDGYVIDFRGMGYNVAERMGLIDRLAAQQIPFEALVYVNKDGKPIARLDASLLRRITGGKYLGLMHAALEEALYEALAGQVEVQFGRWLTDIVPGPHAVEVTFNDGTSESIDLLIGADGAHSATRALVFGPDEQFSRPLGYTIACYPLADRYGIGHTFKMYIEPGRMAAAYCTPQVGALLLFFMYQSAKPEHMPAQLHRLISLLPLPSVQTFSPATGGGHLSHAPAFFVPPLDREASSACDMNRGACRWSAAVTPADCQYKERSFTSNRTCATTMNTPLSSVPFLQKMSSSPNLSSPDRMCYTLPILSDAPSRYFLPAFWKVETRCH